MAAKQLVEKVIADNVIAVFSKSYCPYCRRAKSALSELKVPQDKVAILELDERDDGSDIQAYLAEKTGQRTVPNIFIKQQHIGGCDDTLTKLSNGTIAKLLGN